MEVVQDSSVKRSWTDLFLGAQQIYSYTGNTSLWKGPDNQLSSNSTTKDKRAILRWAQETETQSCQKTHLAVATCNQKWGFTSEELPLEEWGVCVPPQASQPMAPALQRPDSKCLVLKARGCRSWRQSCREWRLWSYRAHAQTNNPCAEAAAWKQPKPYVKEVHLLILKHLSE